MTTFIYHGVRFINDWERSTKKWEIIDRILSDDISTKLIEAATEGINIAKTLVSTHYPPASLPGMPPAQRTGQLLDSIDFMGLERFAVEFGSNLDYSYYLELGTPKILPRPHMFPAGLEAAKLFPELLFRHMAESAR